MSAEMSSLIHSLHISNGHNFVTRCSKVGGVSNDTNFEAKNSTINRSMRNSETNTESIPCHLCDFYECAGHWYRSMTFTTMESR